MSTESMGTPAVVTPIPGVDPRTALATSMQAAPGVYAVLAGSGFSTAAGMPTAWAVIQDLVRRIARVEDVDLESAGLRPEDWWRMTRGSEPRYDVLLEALAPTDAARQALLRQYFDPPVGPDGEPRHLADPHRALGELCAKGKLRLVLTTNFDPLIERALEAAGSPPQVISDARAVEGMIPLPHATATVIKLHGDYTTIGLRNTAEELREYPDQFRQLLARIFDDFGLIVVGWSAEYDTALASAIASCPTRRYPTYWATFGTSLGEPARRLIAERAATVISTAGAAEFFRDLVTRVDRLERRAARHGEPRALRTLFLPPDWSSVPPGWRVLPLLQLRCVAIVPASASDCGYIRPRHRDALLSALRIASVTEWLASLGMSPFLSAIVVGDTKDDTAVAPEAPSIWRATPGGHQTTEHASYRLGGDARSGVSAIASVALPGMAMNTSSVVFVLDIAISLERKLRLGEVARLWTEGLVLTTALLPDALAEVLPYDAEVALCEIHALAAESDGLQHSRTNDLGTRIDLDTLGQATRNIAPAVGLATEITGELSQQAAAAVVADSLELIALNAGYVDPTIGLLGVRHELGVPTG